MKNKKFNKDNRLINSQLLNLFGLQAIRYLLTSFIYFIRGIIFSWKKNNYITTLNNEGIVIINNFLQKKDLNYIKRNFNSIAKLGVKKNLVDGDTTCLNSTISIKKLKKNYILKKIIFSDSIIEILEACERRKFKKNDFFNHKNGKNVWLDILKKNTSKKKDSQKFLHSDTFVNTHKVWFFPDEITKIDGPLTIVKGSHKFSLYRMVLEYFNSVIFKFPTINEKNFKLKKYKEKEFKCIVKSNSLVIANTRAFHKRGNSKIGRIRRQIHWQIRFEPFRNLLVKSY